MRLTARAAALVALGLAMSGCGDTPDQEAEPTPAADSATTAAPTRVPKAAPTPARPREGVCYALPFKAAAAPTTDADTVSCGKEHTSVTFHVGQLNTVVGGHQLAVDSEHVQRKVAQECPRRLGAFVGGSSRQLRLSMLRTTWFSPSLKAASEGENWYRCDVIALAGERELAPLGRAMKGVLATEEGRSRYAVCGTAEPGESDFSRVICSRTHAWRAIASYDLAGEGYPGVESMRDAGSGPCKSAAKAQADDALDFGWALDWPTKEQWSNGQRWGLCWAPA